MTHATATDRKTFQTHPESFIKFIKTDLYTSGAISQAKNSRPGMKVSSTGIFLRDVTLGVAGGPLYAHALEGQTLRLCVSVS
jgi:hypothetical protein